MFVSDRVFDPVGRPEGPQFTLRRGLLRRFAPPDRGKDPVPHKRSVARSSCWKLLPAMSAAGLYA